MTARQKDTGQRLSGEFFEGDTRDVAQSLLGKLLVHRLQHGQRLSGIIVEVEAYLHQDDPASHSHRGRTPRNSSMFEAAGTLYVYSIHAKYCANVVTDRAGLGAAVLIRAAEPWEGVATMMRFRQNTQSQLISTGPARLCQALGITKALDGISLVTSKEVWLESAPAIVSDTRWHTKSGPRIGISQGKDLPYRFFLDGNQFVSGKASEHTMGRNWSFVSPSTMLFQ